MDAYGGNGRDEVVPAGLDCLVSRLGAGLDVRLGRAVTAVAALQGGGVRVRVAGGAAMLADRVIVTVPLGVLKAAGGRGGGGGGGGGAGHEGRGGVAFDPAPPRALQDAIARLGFGEAIKARLPTSPDPDPDPCPEPRPEPRAQEATTPARCPLTALPLPPTTHHSPLTTLHSPPTPHHPRLTTHHSPPTPHHPPLTTHPSPREVALRFPSVFWPRDAHFLGKARRSPWRYLLHTNHGHVTKHT